MYRRRRRRLLLAAAIVVGMTAWMISRMPAVPAEDGSEHNAGDGRDNGGPASAAPAGELRTAPPEDTQGGQVGVAVLPCDPFQRCARKALRGDYGPLADWQRCAYIWGIARGVRCCGLAKVTSYGPWESPRMSGGSTTASGLPVSERYCGANPEIPYGIIVWSDYGVRYVQERGGWVKLGWIPGVGWVTRSTETANLDYYSKRKLATLRETPWAIVKSNGRRGFPLR